MDFITQTSLEALLLKATNSQNENIDTAAVEAFCTLINKEKDGAHIGVKVIASRLPSGTENEVLQTLNILDMCMSRCGSHFQSEVGKFRFLNEMIKLVSPKYLGSHTPLSVKQKVLQLLYVWTVDYPKESKIKEAFDMLRKQGVMREIPNPTIATEPPYIPKKRPVNSVFQDEEKSKILQKLLQSKDPEDIQAANWLIKSMVKEDDKRAELKSRRISELESAQNNVRLLNEMLNSYIPGTTSVDELDLIKELHQSCERLRPNIVKLVSETQKNEDILSDVLQISDELNQVVNKYNVVMLKKKNSPAVMQEDASAPSLLDFEHNVLGGSNSKEENVVKNQSSIDVLCDIFTSNANIPDGDVLQPISVLKSDETDGVSDSKEKNKFKALEDLDVLGEHLLKENLQSSRQTSFNKPQEKIPMNFLTKISEVKQNQLAQDCIKNLDLNYLVNKTKENDDLPALKLTDDEPKHNQDASDDFLVDITDDKMLGSANESPPPLNGGDNHHHQQKKTDTIKLNDIFIKLEDIKPSSMPPMTVLDEKNGISVTLHFAKDKPKDGVFVFVITTISKNSLPLSNYLFQAVVPKGCKLKLQPPSATELPAFNPFLPPSAITQILLIANPDLVQISLKFIVSYVMDDETITEMGDVENLPIETTSA